MTSLFESIPQRARADFLREFLDVYVDRQGLGAVPKADLDALLVHLYCKHAASGNFDSFDLSERFQVKESRIKSLAQLGSLKFDGGLTESKAWLGISEEISDSRFEVESLEKAQVRFKMHNPTLHRFLQKRIRKHEGTMTYSNASEAVTVSLSVLFEVLNDIYENSQTEFRTEHMDRIRPNVERTIQRIGDTLGPDRISALLSGPAQTTKLGKVLGAATNLSGIGSFIVALAAA